MGGPESDHPDGEMYLLSGRSIDDAFGYIEGKFDICLVICMGNGSVQDQIRMSLLSVTGAGAHEDKDSENDGDNCRWRDHICRAL